MASSRILVASVVVMAVVLFGVSDVVLAGVEVCGNKINLNLPLADPLSSITTTPPARHRWDLLQLASLLPPATASLFHQQPMVQMHRPPPRQLLH
jgi:hypothetical protein